MKFKPGDVVRLTGQFVHMTVNNVFGEGENEQARCRWFDLKNRLQDAIFFTVLLEAAPAFVFAPPTIIPIGAGQVLLKPLNQG